MNNDIKLGSDSTIYNYKLVKRVHNNYLYFMLFALLFLLALVTNLLQDQALFFIVCYPAVLVLQIIITKLYLRTVRYGQRSDWRFHYGLLWIGLVPTSFSSLHLVKKIQSHILFGGLLIIGVLYPWISITSLINLLFVHLWLIIPRFFVLFLLRKHERDGLVKINSRDTSCYLP